LPSRCGLCRYCKKQNSTNNSELHDGFLLDPTASARSVRTTLPQRKGVSAAVDTDGTPAPLAWDQEQETMHFRMDLLFAESGFVAGYPRIFAKVARASRRRGRRVVQKRR
jgi:hypothetical protein